MGKIPEVLQRDPMPADGAVEWHTQHASAFDHQYVNNNNFKERYQTWVEQINTYSHQDYAVLDLGCGSGVLTFHAAQKNTSVLGVDGSHEMLKLCQKKKDTFSIHNATFVQHHIHSLPQHLDDKFDLILCSSVLEYLEDIHDSFQLISSFLKRDGALIFSLPNGDSLYRKLQPTIFKLTGLPKYFQHVSHILTIDDTKQLLHSLGLRLIDYRFYAQTPLLSPIFRKMGFAQYSDNLFIAVAKWT